MSAARRAAENTDLSPTACKVKWAGAEVAELGRKVTGEVRKAEAVRRARNRVIRKLGVMV